MNLGLVIVSTTESKNKNKINKKPILVKAYSFRGLKVHSNESMDFTNSDFKIVFQTKSCRKLVLKYSTENS